MSSSSSSSSSSRPCANGAAGLYQFYEEPPAASAIPQNCMKDIGLWTGADVGSWLRWLKFSRTTTTLDGPGLLQVVATNGGNIYKPGEVDPYWSRLTDRERILLKQAIMPFMPGALSPGPEEAVEQEPSAPSTPPGAAASSNSAAGQGRFFAVAEQEAPALLCEEAKPNDGGKDDLEQGIKVSLGTRTPTDALALRAIEGPLVESGRASSSSSDCDQLHSGCILLTKGERVTGGRHSGQNKIVVPESFVSRRHFAIWNGVYLMDDAHAQDPFACGRDPPEEQPSPWRVQDLGSTTGTFLMVRDQARLVDGMAFQLGATEVQVWVVETAKLEEMFGSLGNQLQHRGAQAEPPAEELTEDEELEIFQTALSTLQGVGTSSSSSSAVATSSSAQAPEGKRETEQRRAQTTLLLSFQTSSDVSIAGSFRLANCAESAGTITTVTGRVIENLRPDRTAYLASASSKKTEICSPAVELSPAKITVGRDATNVVSVADMQLSTFHASISASPSFTGPGGGNFVVTDRYSTNRTWIRLSPDGEASPPFAFRLGDVLKVGSSLFMPFDPKDVGLEAEVLAASAARDGDGPLHSELQALVEESEQEMRMAASDEPAAALTSEHPHQDDKRDADPAVSASEMQQAQAALQRAIESELRAKNDEDFDQGFASIDAVTSISSSLNHGTTRMRDLNGRVEFAITSEQWHLQQQAREQQRLWDTATSSLATFNSFRETGAASSSSANGDGRPRHHTTPSGTSGSSPPRPPRPPPAADLEDPSGLLAPSPPRKRFADYSGGAASSAGSNYYGCALRSALPNVILSADAYATQLSEVRREHVERDPGYEERGTIVAAAEEDEEAVAPQEEVGQTGAQGAASSSASTRPTAKETTYVKLQKREDENLCKICFDGELNCCLYPCGHVVCCVECSKKINECPVCRQFIGEVIKLFRV
eukprot:CAMPEP_0179000638 /NCGR_PEP_ID=MMETSP0795-20121207/10806_1 /TAXON_ID=88552 /ORGANISM="Amoebophrya sp., Strain Ameob2" /LENGTH=936 /DNA_ID=CAMNT_0020693703 /DNA_START=179 /DNA_END=2990 /DNA_ORIENTATION=+